MNIIQKIIDNNCGFLIDANYYHNSFIQKYEMTFKKDYFTISFDVPIDLHEKKAEEILKYVNDCYNEFHKLIYE